jgi:CO/xanthine dehydrogenase Mo-binding subunit
MAKTTLLSRRLNAVHSTIGERRVTRLIQQMADRLQMDPADIRRQAEALVHRFAEAGAVTRAAKIAYLANDLGMSEADLLDELRADPVTGHLWRD